MTRLGKDILVSLFLGMAVPGMLLNFGAALLRRAENAQQTNQPAAAQPIPESRTAFPMLLQKEKGEVAELDLDTYLVGVVLAEMPASFEEEALKAQAVVARTYARKACTTGGKHGNGSVCTAPACCQGYTREEDYLARGGSPEAVEKVRNAVLATSGQVLTYEGELIEATYFSCSGGRTEDAAAVWGTEFPYLQAVDSPGEESASHYTDTHSFTPEEFAARLQLPLTGNPASWLGTATYTEGGGISTMVIGGKQFSGTQLRSLLGLRSTAFSVAPEEPGIVITTRGYGHRVGMSQYGADAMAVSGSSYGEILAHYYPGTVLTNLAAAKG